MEHKIDDVEIEEKRKKLMENLNNPLDFEFPLDNPYKYKTNEINWCCNFNTWEETKNLNIDEMQKFSKMFLIAHSQDIIKGKPQLIHQTIQRIPIIRFIQKPYKDGFGDRQTLSSYKFIDDRYDKRYDGNEVSILAFDFWVYRLIDEGKEYYIFSQNKLSQEYSCISGMKIDLEDSSDLNMALKVKKISSIFLLKDFKPNIKTLNKEDLIKFTKSLKDKNGWDMKGFLDFVFTAENGKIYDYSDDFNLLRVSQLLSSKYEGYPLHLFKMGQVGTGKTTEAEILSFKFQEEQGILEAGSSRMKVLVPSFKEKPANLGYICKCNRLAIIDELMKMVSNVINYEHIDPNNYFGGLNMLLEHKDRMIGSGNDNSTRVQATAKVCITTNPLEKKDTIYSHLNTIDPSTLSRMVVWIQDEEEVKKIYDKNSIRNNEFILNLHLDDNNDNNNNNDDDNNNSRSHSLMPTPFFTTLKTMSAGINDFLSIYDSSQTFLIDFDEKKVKKCLKTSIILSKEPMTSIWKARGLHHAILILDGLVKFRCLFRDYDITFTPLEEDYDLLERLLVHIVKTWDTNFNGNNWKESFNLL